MTDIRYAALFGGAVAAVVALYVVRRERIRSLRWCDLS
jgi:hypothetical protein